MPSMARRFRDILGFVTDIAIRFKMALTTSYLHTKCRTAHYCAQPWQKRLAIDLDVFVWNAIAVLCCLKSFTSYDILFGYVVLILPNVVWI